jgi:5-methylcytosine-specific restriction endonuclease McrA
MPKGVYTRKPTQKKGEKHHNWKGGLPKCIDCPKQLSNYGNKRCGSCSQKFKNSNAKEVVGYSRVHKWLVDMFGNADKCENEQCDGTSTFFEWSLISGRKYERVRENFWMLCKKCHNVYDAIYEKRKKK